MGIAVLLSSCAGTIVAGNGACTGALPTTAAAVLWSSAGVVVDGFEAYHATIAAAA